VGSHRTPKKTESEVEEEKQVIGGGGNSMSMLYYLPVVPVHSKLWVDT
jgi:hypothetical protein